MPPPWLLCALLGILPPSEPYAESSLPAEIAKALAPRAADGLYGVRRFREPDRALWLVTLPCHKEGVACPTRLFLADAKGYREVGKASGDLVDADPEDGVPRELWFHTRGSSKETVLELAEGKYSAHQAPRRYRDPLTRERIDADELRSRGMTDLKEGHFAAAAGRYSLLCEDPCPVLDVETLATALLQARLFEQAESALRRAVEMPGHQLQDLRSLASLLLAEGHERDAMAVEARLSRETGDAGR